MTDTRASTEKAMRQPNVTNVDHLTNWVLRLIPAVIVGRAAWMKLSGDPDAAALFSTLDMEPGGRILIGVIELLSVALLLSPRISGWGALLSLGVMVGAVLAHASVIGFDGPLGMLFVMALIAGSASIALLCRLRHQVPFVKAMFEM